MFGAVNTNQEYLIFDGESRDLVAIHAHRLPPRKEFFDRKPARKVTHGALGMQLHEEGSCDSNENVLPRNPLGANCLGRNFRLVAGGNHQLGGAKDIFLADEKIEIPILSCPGVAISL